MFLKSKKKKNFFILTVAIIIIFLIVFLSLAKKDGRDNSSTINHKNINNITDDFMEEDIFEDSDLSDDFNVDFSLDKEIPSLNSLESSKNNYILLESELFYEEEINNNLIDKNFNNSLSFVKPKNCQYHLVTRVYDGDTVGLANGERVRYIGIDTPETVHPSKPVECFGREASAKNKELVLNKEVCLVKDVTDRDRYGRLLRYVYLDDKFINLELVRLGYATSYSYPPDISQQHLFIEAQKQAREQELGLWSACNNKEEIDWNGQCLIKGNISSGGKIYHLPNCGSYDKTVIDESLGEKWFCSEQEAIEAGWRRALNCE